MPQKPMDSISGPQSHPAWQAGLRMSAWFTARATFDMG